MKTVILEKSRETLTEEDLCNKAILGLVIYKRFKTRDSSSSHVLLARLQTGWGFVDMFGYDVGPTYISPTPADCIRKAIQSGRVVKQYHDLEEFYEDE